MCDISDFEDGFVEMSDYNVVGSPSRLETNSLATCIGVAVIDHVHKRGYLCHYAGIASSGVADEFFSRLKECSQVVSVCVAGGDVSQPDCPVQNDRNAVLRQLSALFPTVTPDEFWSGPGESCWIVVDMADERIRRGKD